MVLRKKEASPIVIAADVVAIAHFIVGNIALFIGEFTDLMSKMNSAHPGMEFIYNYLDRPVYRVLERVLNKLGFDWLGELHDTFFNILSAEFVIVAASIVYGITTYLVLKIISLLFGFGK